MVNRNQKLTADAIRADIMSDPAASYWLKEAIRKLDNRDPIDAYNDAQILRDYCDTRCREILGVKRS